MDLSKIIEMKNESPGATATYNNREIFIRKIYDNSGLIEVVDLINGDVYTLHSSKIDAPLPNIASHSFQ